MVKHTLLFLLRAVSAIACWCLETISQFQCGHFGISAFTVGISVTIAPRSYLDEIHTRIVDAALPSRNRDLVPLCVS
ncbi:hypothetical protein [Nitrosomonas halophila]|uniref:Secreted protein n=1 Tax=Nitrosomonas halophila TaxID=44576 RepID=A0A1H3NA30_9PROT|nr:hypothetical protein [Nitrosomonas halophila]SDY85325.1 hypothetical protein SAMN05421881_10704 [Nitrosomonas halophila]